MKGSKTAAATMFWAGMFFLFCGSASAVTAAPNASVVEGRVLKYSAFVSTLEGISPEMTIYEVVVDVDSSRPSEAGGVSFAKAGEKIRVFSTLDMTSESLGRFIRAEVVFKGDEWGGKYWLRRFELIEKKEGNRHVD